MWHYNVVSCTFTKLLQCEFHSVFVNLKLLYCDVIGRNLFVTSRYFCDFTWLHSYIFTASVWFYDVRCLYCYNIVMQLYEYLYYIGLGFSHNKSTISFNNIFITKNCKVHKIKFKKIYIKHTINRNKIFLLRQTEYYTTKYLDFS